jgi:type II secretory ATPase GspE/PulE/Tfp pilus assembly ATPase PilB-like protein
MTDMAITWLDRVIDHAFSEKVSDIHLEYIEDNPSELRMRVRISGELIQWEGLAGNQARAVISRIKSIADVGSGTVRKSEEGRYLHRMGSGEMNTALDQLTYDKESAKLPRRDLRLVVLPTILGEKHVLRLPSISQTPKIPELGFSRDNLGLVAGLFGWANGLVLFAGPVGAGKTTSMYSALDYLGGPGKAVYSVEDPVERSLPNVDQMEVNDAAGNSFASILRSLRRGDLQVLMIGEIRDPETAYSAIQISIAGSRVVSSIHANDSIAAVEAMLALSGANPHQVMQSLRGIVSQRLVKRVHVACRAEGCADCGGTGVDGRLAIHEVLPITPEFSEAVTRRAHRTELSQLAKAAGMRTLREDAQRRLDSGETTARWVAEVLGSE